MSVVTRVAPSPTGEPHVGTAYVSLFNWAWAKRNGGRFILRTEDTDRARSKSEHETAIIEALAWLGITPDESPLIGGPVGPYRQSERSDIYRESADTLLASGHAYRCFCTAERLAELREAQKAAKGALGYDGLCRDIPAAESAARAAKEAHVVRLRVDKTGSTKFHDLLRGEIEITNDNVDDQVLLKSDGMPTYHMANVVDDHMMGVTIIMRAEEWIPSTPKHVLLYAAFGWTSPIYAHVPLLRNADKSKISKRKNPTSILWYREQGFLPEALVNFLALQGWSMGETDPEEFEVEDFIARFDPKNISVGGPVFDITKLEWLNGEKIRKLSVAELAERLLSEGFAEGWTAERVEQVLPLFRERMKTLADFQAGARFLVERIEPDLEGLNKKLKQADPGAVSAALIECCEALVAREGQPDEDRENALREIATKHDLKVGNLFMGLRVGVTGATASPPLLPSIDALGTTESVARVRDLAERLVASR